MKSPITSKEMIFTKEVRPLNFRKENFNVWYHYYLCEDSGEQFTTTELDKINTSQCYNQYREKYAIPFPDQIFNIRNQYDINASKMSDILGMGANSYRNYEQGEIPSVSNGRLILAASDPVEFLRFVEASKSILVDKEYEKIKYKVEILIKKLEINFPKNRSKSIVFEHTVANQFTGYVVPSYEKIAQVILYFAKQAFVLKTKLNKLLFYTDYLHFSRTGYGISGMSYRAIQMGPVPAYFDNLYSMVTQDEIIQIDYIEFESGLGERFIPNAEFREDLFSESELIAITDICTQFGSITGKQLIEISHEELAWIECEASKSIISYQKYGFILKAVA